MHGTESLTAEPTAKAAPAHAALPSFCIALPVYNEAGGIERCVSNIARFLETVPTRTAIVAVDDGSKDETWAILSRLAEEFPALILERHAQNAGYGGAQRTLCRVAAENGFEYALVMDADGTQDPRYIAQFFPAMTRGVEFIKATRYDLGGGVEGVPWQRYVISLVGNKLARLAMRVPLTDFSNGFRAIRTEAWARIKTTERGFLVLIEEVTLARALGLSFAEVPYTLTVRQDPGSVSKFSYRWDVYWNFLRYILK